MSTAKFLDQLRSDIKSLTSKAEKLNRDLESVRRRLYARKELLRIEEAFVNRKKPREKKMTLQDINITIDDLIGLNPPATVKELSMRLLHEKGKLKLGKLVDEIGSLRGKKVSKNGVWIVLSSLVKKDLVVRGSGNEKGYYWLKKPEKV